MAKIRAIHPEFWTDEKVVEGSPLARLLFIGLWNHACDNGHVKDRPRQLKLRILPADDCDVSDLLDELVNVGLITRAGGWVTVPKLGVRQKIDKRYFLTCDHPGCGDAKPLLTTRREAPPSVDDEPPAWYEPTPDTRRGPAGDTAGARGAHGGDTRVPSTDGDGDGDGDTSSSELRPDVAELLDHLDRCIVANGAKKPNRTKGNQDAARLLIDRDGRPLDEAHRLIDWATSDPFWRSNILSMVKFREKYDQLRIKAQGVTLLRPTSDGWMNR